MGEHKPHVTIEPTRIISMKIKYFIGALLQEGVTVEQIEDCINWAENTIEISATLFEGDEIVSQLASRF